MAVADFPSCVDALTKFTLADGCFSILLSKLLGTLIIVGSVVVKVPQILNIAKSRSVEGLSHSMFALELVGYTVSWAYCVNSGFPFSTWGEYVFMALQNVIIMFQLAYFTGRAGSSTFLLSAVAYLAIAATLIGGFAGMPVLLFLQSMSIPLFLSSRVPQIISNFKTKSTGQLSAVTAVMNFGGTAARVFTTLKEVDDKVMLASSLLGIVLNGTIMVQIFAYWSNTNKALKKKAK